MTEQCNHDPPLQVVPQLRVADMHRSIAFYHDVLGLSPTVLDPPDAPVFASLEAGDVTLFLVADEDMPSVKGAPAVHGAGVRIFFEVDDAEGVYNRLVESDVPVAGPPVRNEEADYVEFRLTDPDGYEICVYS
ncbi:MAG TPA: VOC family protein [Chthonomonadales bacterium]|nr:VOC family protein [Chthonomonadales bacterium]